MRNGLNKNRICFKDLDFETAFVKVPVVDESGRKTGETRREITGKEDVIDLFLEYEEIDLSIPAFELLRLQWRRICPEGLFDNDIEYLLLLESRCRRFEVLPEEGSLDDQPEWLMQIFDIIEAIRNQFEELNQPKLKSDKSGS